MTGHSRIEEYIFNRFLRFAMLRIAPVEMTYFQSKETIEKSLPTNHN